MLVSLYVKNFAIIEDLKIEFEPNMTVLTGETGAGKSLIIDTISLLLGQRADSDMIRYGQDKAYIEGVFTYNNEHIDELLERFSIPKFDRLIIKRTISNIKSSIKINDVVVNLSMLKQIANLLADIHTQNDTYHLFNPETYLDFITPKDDNIYDGLFTKYTLSYAKYLECYDKYFKVLNGQKESLERLEFLEYEKKEIESLNLYPNIDVELEMQVAKLKNYDKIFSSLNNAYNCLENEYFSIDEIYNASKEIEKISDLDENFNSNKEKLMDSYYILEDIKSNIYKEIKTMDFDEEELNYKQELLNNIDKVKSKYHKSIDELMEYLNNITLQIEMVNNYDLVLEEVKTDLNKAYNNLKDNALKLSNYRQKYAKAIEKGIIKECHDLDLNDILFEIEFKNLLNDDIYKKEQFKFNGIDEVSFMVSFNKGEPKRSLHKVASGGEMSRMMLAFKSYFLSINKLSLMVFDEIDTGVSGQTAKKIADKLYNIGQENQVLCITHLPQVAAIGNNHIHIYKEVVENRTTTHIKKLNKEQRIEEVALMLSGDRMSVYALEHAKALLNEKK